MAIAYKSAGAGVGTATSGAVLQPPCPSVVDANDILIAHVCYRNTATTPSTPSGWTLLAGPQTLSTIGRHWIYGRLAAGNEDGTTVSFGGQAITVVRHARVYSFSGYVSGTITDVVSDITHATATSATVADTSVTTTIAEAVAVQLAYAVDDNGIANSTVRHMTGETGGDWTNPVGWYTATLGADGLQFIQVATMASPGTISGGSVTIGASDPWGCYGFQIIPSNSISITPAAINAAPAIQQPTISQSGASQNLTPAAINAAANVLQPGNIAVSAGLIPDNVRIRSSRQSTMRAAVI